jgi:hypothetical protein
MLFRRFHRTMIVAALATALVFSGLPPAEGA